MSYIKKDEDGGDVGIFYHLDKTTVLQEARVFNESPINPRKCRLLLTKVLYLMYLGETFTTTESTELFFGVTKLFQSMDAPLRQMVCVMIKELSAISDDVIMVRNSLMKDMQAKSDVIYRSNAIRALYKITDATMFQGVERFLKAAIVDKTSAVSSSALLFSYHLFPIAKDVIRRWSNEVQEAVNAGRPGFTATASAFMTSFTSGSAQQPPAKSTSHITQYHALGLLYLIKQHDRMALIKLVQTLVGGGKSSYGSPSGVLKNPFAICLIIRYTAKIIEEDPSTAKQLGEMLEGFLHHKNDTVSLEAARVICDIVELTGKDLHSAISVLQLFLASPKPTLRFAAIRTLNKLAMTHPSAVASCNVDMENLITDSNRSIATFAITTLLKTGNEASVDRLMKQISGFMSEISDEFKIIVVEAVRSLCLKFPQKQASVLSFLSGLLRDEGGYEFKKAVVEAIFDLIKFIPECKETALAHLCEFIEDCEFTKLSVRVLHLLGEEGPCSAKPTNFIRFIYNRVILENSVVRAAAVSALAKFGVNCNDEDVKKNIRVLLTRCLDDSEDEVRDRSTLFLKVMAGDASAEHFVREDSTLALGTLERQLLNYCNNPEAANKPFDFSDIPRISKSQEESDRLQLKNAVMTQTLGIPVNNTSAASTNSSTSMAANSLSLNLSDVSQHEMYVAQLEKIPEFEEYGPLFKSSSKPIELTEKETEYVVTCIKHCFHEHIVFQFNITNTLQEYLLQNVYMLMQPESDEYGVEEVASIPAEAIACDQTGVAYVSFRRKDVSEYSLASFINTLKFVVKECDPTSGDLIDEDDEGYEDEYQVEDIELLTGDYMKPTYEPSFVKAWDQLEAEVVETFFLDPERASNIKTACSSLIDLLGMQPLEDTANPKSSTAHSLIMSGELLEGGKVLARCRMTHVADEGVALELTVRSENEETSQVVLGAIA
ncbi:uncharacterized protein VTP21DRAFT_7369 [Calcarisporiella thermophila]|uniref:uncharacterized protein n=1 Tax=Calcarisporiella thermophila TaxID=911321 RepID=UPI0037448126